MTQDTFERAKYISERIKDLKMNESFISKIWQKTNDDEIKNLCSLAHHLATELIERNKQEFEKL